MTRETIANIVKGSGVSAGELILIHFWGENADKTAADQFAAAVAALGASPVVLQQARSVNREIFAGAKESVLGYELEDAQLELTGRTWLADAGDGDLPCGEIYIAPVEAKTNGEVFFGTLYLEGEAYTDVTLQVTNGEITGSSQKAAAAYEKAKEDYDPVRLQLEKLKLDTVGEIQTQFKKIWEGAE